MTDAATDRRGAIEYRRQLHARIARSRRRLHQRGSRLIQGGLLPFGWRKYIQDHPAIALATAAGAGMLLAQVGSRSGVARKSADWLAEWLAGSPWTSLIKQLERFLPTADAEADETPSETEPSDA